jgi:transcriptional regulator with AAA-type ATPase domain
MKYFTFIGNHDIIDSNTLGFGAALTIFFSYLSDISGVYIFTSSDKHHFAYRQMAEKTKLRMQSEKKGLSVNIIELELENPTNFDLVYTILLDEVLKVIETDKISENKKIINITSGTPTMTTCWVLLQKSGLIPNADLVQSYEPKFQRKYGKPCQTVNLNIDNFPLISSPPSKIKRELMRAKSEIQLLKNERETFEVDQSIPGFIGVSNSIRDIKEQIIRLVTSDTHVLILGEPGTGKEIIARAIWNTYRKETDSELSVFDCGQFEPGLLRSELFGHEKGAFTGADRAKTGILEHSNNKTLYLDEIGNISLDLQLTLMRFLQFGDWKKVGASKVQNSNIQIIAATNKNINDPSVFAPDLRDRFDEIINISPLRERFQDIETLAKYFLIKNNKNVTFGKSIFPELVKYSWKGNVRQLEKWVYRVCRYFQDIHLEWEDINKNIRPDSYANSEEDQIFPDFPINLNHYTDGLRFKALEITNGNMTQADGLLGFKKGNMKQWMFQRKKRKKL